MKRHILLIALLFAAICVMAQVKPGIEVLRDNGFKQLQGKRIGLITNPTGVDSQLNSTADILANAPGVKVAAFFAPEHGIRGNAQAGASVKSYTDPVTGIPVYSLYGSTKKPTAAMLADVDVLVYDIQDNGCRSYTFISTMGKAMEAAAEYGKEFIVLDRPNPLGGERIEGRGVDPDCISFVSQYDIPYIYGLTAGELAKYLKGERLIAGADKLKLTVIGMDGWHRDMLFADTGLPWVPTSPNIPTAETCLYYPATGIAGELSFYSIGIGTTLPFKIFATPWIDGVKLATNMNNLRLPGVRFRPVTMKPTSAIFANETVNGVEIFITDPLVASLTDVQFHLMEQIHKMYPSRLPLAATEKNKSRLRMFDQVMGSTDYRPPFAKTYNAVALLKAWHQGEEQFRARRAPYIIYD